MDAYTCNLYKLQFMFIISALCIYDYSLCTTINATHATPETTLASDLKLHDVSRIYVIAGAILLGIPVSILCCCLVRSIVTHRREKKITDDEDLNFQHPPPAHPVPRPFLQRDNTVAGPFRNPAFGDDDEGTNGHSRVVTPSFISTRIVNEPGFGMPPQHRRYQYIP